MGEFRSEYAYRISVGKREGAGHGRTTRVWEDNNEMNVKKYSLRL
jgi:hypothetical protein